MLLLNENRWKGSLLRDCPSFSKAPKFVSHSPYAVFDILLLTVHRALSHKNPCSSKHLFHKLVMLMIAQ